MFGKTPGTGTGEGFFFYRDVTENAELCPMKPLKNP